MAERRTRIAIIAEYFPPRLGGDRRIYELVSRLPRSKYEVFFITLPPSYLLFISRVRRKPPRDSEMCHMGIMAIVIGCPDLLLRLWQRTFLAAYALTLAYLVPRALIGLSRASPNLIIVNNTSVYTGLMGLFLSLITRTKLLVDFNDLESEYTFEKVNDRIPESFRGAVRLILKTVEDIILRRSNSVVTVHTEFLRRYAERRHKKRVLYVPDGVDVGRFAPNNVSKAECEALKETLGVGDARLCAYAGRIDWNIGGGLLLGILELLNKKSAAMKCLVLGEGEPDLVDRMRQLDTTLYLGLRSPEEVPKYIALADVVLVPYPLTKASHSVSPLKLFEAMAMGKPVVASNVSGVRDVVEDGWNGILADDKPEEWVRAIENVVKDRNLYSRLSKNALATASRYDWSILSRDFENAITLALSYGRS